MKLTAKQIRAAVASLKAKGQLTVNEKGHIDLTPAGEAATLAMFKAKGKAH